MKRLLLIMFFITLPLLSDAQSWAWAKKGSNGSGGANKIVTDNNNNSFVIGYCNSNGVVFPGLTIQPNFAGTGTFIASLDSEGNALWGKAYKFSPGDIVIDNSSNIYISGGFQDSLLEIDGFNLLKDNGATSSMCLIKMNSSGSVLSVYKPTAHGYSYIQKMSVDNTGSLYLSGGFGGDSITFGSHTLYNLNFYFSESFLCKMDPSGSVSWVKAFNPFYSNSSAHRVWVQSIATTTDNSISVALTFTDSIFVIENDTIRANYGLPHTIIIKYNSQGDLQSHYLMKGGNIVITLSGDLSNNLVMGGSFGSDSLTLGNNTIQNPYASGGSRGVFLAKMQNDETFPWVNSFGGSINCITTDHANNVIVGGKYGWQLVFGTDTLRAMDPPSHGKPYVASFDSNGNYLWSKNAVFQGSYWDDFVTGVSAGTDNTVYVSGRFSSDTLNFDSTMLVNSSIYHGFPNPPDVFVSKIFLEGVGVQSLAKTQIQLYPNPSQGLINIRTTEFIKCIEVCDLLGRSCIKKMSQEAVIDLSELSPGTYFIKVETRSNVVTSGLVLQR